jgi:hypothetical protein
MRRDPSSRNETMRGSESGRTAANLFQDPERTFMDNLFT